MSRDNNGKAMPGWAKMKGAKRRQELPAGGATAVFASGIAVVVFILIPLIAFAAVPPSRSAAQENPRFASLQIEVWPEFDRRGAALVILKGELPAELALPAAVSLRIPASSGGPAAVAFTTAPGAELFNLAHDRSYSKDFITLRFEAPQRFVHIEFYDPLVTRTPDRSYSYVWASDLAVGRLSVRLQEPAAASNISVQPDLGAGVPGPDALLYRTAELGAFKAGKPLPIEIRYTKSDGRTSSDILGLKVPDSAPAVTSGTGEALPDWLLVLAIFAGVVGTAGIAGSLWWRRRGKASGAQPGGGNFCAQCGNRLTLDARFCPTCGAAVRNKSEMHVINHGNNRNSA